MSGEIEQLVVSLEARVTNFEKSFQRASRAANENWRSIEDRGQQGAKRLELSFKNAGQAAAQMTAFMSKSSGGDPYKALTESVHKHSAELGLNRMQQMELMHVSRALFDELASGQNIFRALAMEGGRIGEIFGQSKGGVGQVFAALGPTVARFLPVIAAAAAAFALFETSKKSIEHLQHVVEGSEKANVSANLFQAWTDQATRLRLTVEEAEAAITRAGKSLEPQLNPTKGNAGGDLSKRANYLSDYLGHDTESKQAIENAKSMDELHHAALLVVKDYIDASRELQSQGLELASMQRRIDANRVATEVWGDAGKKVAEGIADGSLKIDEFEQRSKNAGRVWSDEILEAGKKVSKEIELANHHLGDEMKPALESVAAATLGILDGWAKVVNLIARGVGLANQMAAALHEGPQELRDMAAAKADPTGGVPFKDAFAKYLQPEAPHPQVDVPLPPSRPSSVDDVDVKEPKAHKAKKEKTPKEPKEDDYEKKIDELNKQARAFDNERESLGKLSIEQDKSKASLELLEAAKKANLTVDDAMKAKIDQTATAYANAKEKLKEAQKAQEEFKSASQEVASTLGDAFKSMAVDGEKFNQVLKNILKRLESKLIDKIFSQAISGAGGDGGLFGTLFSASSFASLGKTFGFASGGHVTGPGTSTSDSIPAMLSTGEFVVNAGAVRGNRALLEALNSGHTLRFASGGIVGAPPALSSPPVFSGVGGPHVAINSPITVNASGGTPAQNQDLAKQLSASVEQSMRATVISEIAAQMRQGNLLSTRYTRQ
jgi:hypothetical protein